MNTFNSRKRLHWPSVIFGILVASFVFWTFSALSPAAHHVRNAVTPAPQAIATEEAFIARSDVVPHRIANVAVDDVKFVMAVEPNPGDFLSDLLVSKGAWETNNMRLIGSLVKKRLNLNAPCLALDVGANQGIYSLYMAKLGCKVISFEMQVRVAALNKLSIALNGLDDKITLIKRPVYDVEKSMYYVGNKVNLGATGMYEKPSGSSEEIRVDTVRIDDVVNEYVAVMKMDVEGSEYHALKSMSKLFDRDMVGDILMETRGTSRDAVDFLYGHGYSAYRLKSIDIPLSQTEIHESLGTLAKTRDIEDFLYKKRKL